MATRFTVRNCLFGIGVAGNAVSLLLVFGLWHVAAKWNGLYGHVSNLGWYVAWGALASLVGFVFSWFGCRWLRIISLVVSLVLFYFWYLNGSAV